MVSPVVTTRATTQLRSLFSQSCHGSRADMVSPLINSGDWMQRPSKDEDDMSLADKDIDSIEDSDLI